MTEWVPSLLFSLVYCKHKWKRNALNCVEPRHPTWKTKTHQSHARSKCRALFLRFSPPTKKSCVCVCLQNKTSNYCKKESILSTVTLKKTSSNVTDLQTKRGKKKRNRVAWIQLCDSWVQGGVAKNSNAVGNPPVRYPLVFF